MLQKDIGHHRHQGVSVQASPRSSLEVVQAQLFLELLVGLAETALGEGQRDVIFIHYVRNRDAQAFGQQLAAWREAYPWLIVHVVFEDGAEADMPSGRPTLEHLRAWVPAGAEAYVLGPKPFMGFVNHALVEIGVPGERRHHEFFGPAEALD